MSYIKMFSDSHGVQSCKKYIQIILFYFSSVPKSVPVVAQQTKMAAIESLNFGSTDQSINCGGINIAKWRVLWNVSTTTFPK